jgi:phosphodiesterase/alkaline phosphatase D-like protein
VDAGSRRRAVAPARPQRIDHRPPRPDDGRCRVQRPAAGGHGRPATPRDDQPPILNVEQWSALEDRIRDAQAPWHLVANQVQVAPTRLGYVPSPRPPYVRPLVNPDQWDGFPAERTQLYAALASSRPQPVLLSGDLHSAWFREVRDRRRTARGFRYCAIRDSWSPQ